LLQKENTLFLKRETEKEREEREDGQKESSITVQQLLD
jgi:hypothetical protein